MKTPYHDHKDRGENNAPVDADTSATVVFIEGGLRAARNIKPSLRDRVMRDVSHVLGCEPGDLDFILNDGASTENSDNADVYDFPDAERRRKFLEQNNLLDAAE